MAENPEGRAVGTALATLTYLSSGVPSPLQPTRNKWGGARNRADRISDTLSHSAALNLIAAVQFAMTIGLPLNRHITIHWERMGVTDARAAAATGRYLKLVGDWLKKRGGSFAWIWVRENDEGHGLKGSHVHILAHVPLGCDWGRMQRRWLRRIADRPYRSGAARTRRVGGSARAWQSNPAGYAANLELVLGYVLKGVNAATAEAIGIGRWFEGGRVTGKRTATSQNIATASRGASLR